jgi:hypothetical protein
MEAGIFVTQATGNNDAEPDMPHWGPVKFRASTPEPRELPDLQMIDPEERARAGREAVGNEIVRAPPQTPARSLGGNASPAGKAPEAVVTPPARKSVGEVSNRKMREVCACLVGRFVSAHACMHVCTVVCF